MNFMKPRENDVPIEKCLVIALAYVYSYISCDIPPNATISDVCYHCTCLANAYVKST